MDDVWFCVDEDNSSNSSVYSDIVDSETEAELYGMIHHQGILSDTDHPYKGHSANDQSHKIVKVINCQTEDLSCIESNTESNFTFSLTPQTKSSNDSYLKKTSLDKSSFQKNVLNFSTPLKRKSDSGAVILCSEDSNTKNSKQLLEHICISKKVCKNSPINKKILKQQNVVALDSSDSDESIIWAGNDMVSTDLKMNLSNDVDTISISSISDSQAVISSPFRRNEMILENLSLSNIKIERNSKDLWYVDDEDLYRSKKRSRRYHITNEITCSNCDKKGHSAKSCPVPKAIKCFICGGPHAGSQCRDRICSKCYRLGHDSRFCWMTSINYCSHCNMKGHIKKVCPDIWRRYHLTTGPVKIVAGKPLSQDKTIYCFNCGWAGHFGSECKEIRFSKYSFTTWPCVVSYSNPDELLIKRIDLQRNTDLNYMKIVHKNDGPQLNNNKDFIAERKEKKKVRKWQIFKQRQIEGREKNFPRTPKKSLKKIENSIDGLPESVELVLKDDLKKKKRNQKRKRNRQKKYLKTTQNEDM